MTFGRYNFTSHIFFPKRIHVSKDEVNHFLIDSCDKSTNFLNGYFTDIVEIESYLSSAVNNIRLKVWVNGLPESITIYVIALLKHLSF